MEGGRLGPYAVVRELGKGGMATVYLGRVEEDAGELAAGDPVAIKVIHPHLVGSGDFLDRFLREVRIGQRIRHENVVQTFDAATAADGEGTTHYMVMEYVEGETLRELLGELGWVPEKLCRHIGREVAKALEAIHDAGIVHRDLKPENVLITRDDVVKVMDLGVARLKDEALKLSQTGQFVGSMLYAAPEQFQGGGADIDFRLDLYALGLTLFELACGVNPFRDTNMASVIRRVLFDEPRPLSELNPQISPFLEEVIRRLMAKSREDRFSDAPAVVAVLTKGEESSWWFRRSEEIRTETKKPLRRIRIPRETGLYGRDREVDLLRDLFGKVKAGEGQTVVVRGEAGIGKTRLVDEFAALLEREGEEFNFLFGSFPPGGAATGSDAFRTAYREHLGADSLPNRLAEHLTVTPALVPAFAAYLRGEPPPAGVEPLTKDSLRTVFIHLTRALAAERPTVVLIDDLHFAPEEGRALFAALAMALGGHRVLLVGTTRPGLSESWRREIEGLERTTGFEVGRLTKADLEPLLLEAFRSSRLADRLDSLIARKTDGNPFFVFEVIRGLQEGQFLARREDGTWVATQAITKIEIPSSVKDLVAARISDLSEEERDMLDVAACCGFDFDPVLVGEALGMGRIPALKMLGRLERDYRLVRSAGRRFFFDHHQVQEVLHEGLSQLLREEYHAALGDTLEERSGAADREPSEVTGGLAVELAGHFLWGRRGERARCYLHSALDHLEREYRNERLIEMADRALAMEGLFTGPDRVELLLKKLTPSDLLGLRAEQREVLDEARKLADAGGDPGLRARVRRRLGEYLWSGNEFDEARESLSRAIELAREAGDLGEVTAATGSLANVHLRTGGIAEARGLYERQLETAREIGDPREEGRATGNLGVVAFRSGDRPAARKHYERYLEISRKLGDKRGEANAAGNLGILCHASGDAEEAREWVELQLALAREIGDRRSEGSASGTLGIVLRDLGRWEGARECHERHREIAREIGDRRAEGIATGNLGLLLKKTGRFEEARECHADHLRIAREIGDRRGEGQALLSLATTLEALGRLGEAREGYREQYEAASRIGDIGGRLLGGVNLGMLRVKLGEREPAEGVLCDVVALAGKYGAKEVEGFALGALASLGMEADPVGARDRLERALSLGEEAGTRPGRTEALLALGRLAESEGNPGEAVESYRAATREIAEDREEAGLRVLSACLLAALDPTERRAAEVLLEEHEVVLEAWTRMEARFALYRASKEEEHLDEAIRILNHLAEGLENEEVERLLTTVPLCRAIRAAAEGPPEGQ